MLKVSGVVQPLVQPLMAVETTDLMEAYVIIFPTNMLHFMPGDAVALNECLHVAELYSGKTLCLTEEVLSI